MLNPYRFRKRTDCSCVIFSGDGFLCIRRRGVSASHDVCDLDLDSALRFGYRGVDARRNLWVLPTGEIMYYVAAVAVLYDRDEDAQRHYVGHTEDIMW